MAQFKNLIFDIGDVLVDINYQATVAEFQKLALVDFNEIVSYSRQHHIFDAFEKGEVTAQQFRDALKQFLKPNVSDDDINRAWNAILIDYPLEKFELLRQLKPSYQLFALSNINEIHVQSIDKAAREFLGETAFANFFNHAYYSNEVGFRKPEKGIYELVISQQNLNPSETFFVDDKLENVNAALEAGLQAYQLTDRNQLRQLLLDVEIL